jgi:hypothetical protein
MWDRGKRKNQESGYRDLFQKSQVSAFVSKRPGGFLYEFHELPQAVALDRRHAVETNANSVGRTIARDHSTQGKSLYPDLTVWHPKTDGDLGAGLHWICRFDQASAHAGVRQISPNWGWGLVNAQFDGNEALDPRVPSPVASQARTE